MDTTGGAGGIGSEAKFKRGGFFGSRFMRRHSIGVKLWSTTAILSIPVLVLAAVYAQSLSSTLGATATEQQGYLLFKPLDRIALKLGRREELTTTALVRRSNAGVELKNLDEEIDSELTEFDALDLRRGNAATHTELKDFHTEWGALKAAAPGTPQDGMAAHERLMDTLEILSAQVGNDWLLTLDPEITAYNLIDITTTKVPAARRNLSEARAHMAAMYAGADYVAAEGARVASLIALFNDRMASARDEMKIAATGATNRPALVVQLGDMGNDWDVSIDRWSAMVARELTTGRPAEDAIRSLLGASAEYSTTLDTVQNVAVEAAGTALHLRYVTQWRNAALAIAGSLFAVIAALLLMIALSRRVAGAVARLRHINNRISAGCFDTPIDPSGSDEISLLFAEVKVMQQGLLERQRTQAAASTPAPTAAAPGPADASSAEVQNARIRSALDSVSGCVMVADNDGRIVYTNSAVDGLLRRAEADIRKQLPGFTAAAVRGSDFEVFHKRPQNQRQMLAGLTRQHTAQIELGGRTFGLVLNPVLSAQGERLGTAVEWTDRTLELTVQDEVDGMLQAVLGGDLSHRIGIEGKTGFFEGLGRGMNSLVDNVGEIITKAQTTARDVHEAADKISDGNVNLSQRIVQQSASLEQTAASMEQITSTVKQNADNAHQANQLASAAREQAQAGGAVVSQAITAMADIDESSKKIANIIGVIDEIAFQTNLLALNAAVEAARAGEQGRGFAVVASEVRNLAGRSAGAAKEIKELIRDSVGKVAGGTQLVAQSGKTLEQIVTAVKKVTDVVAEIASASGEQTRGIEQVSSAIAHMDEMTQQNSALVEETSTASQAMARQVDELTRMLSGYRIGAAGAAVRAPARSKVQAVR